MMRRHLTILLFSIVSLLPLTSIAAVYTVNNLGDAGAGAGNNGDLRYCIQQANAIAGPHTINFSVAGTINLASNLPSFTRQTLLDGATAPGYAVGSPVVELTGFSFILNDVNAGGSTIRGMVIRNMNQNGMELFNAANLTIEYCFIGTNMAGTASATNAQSGILAFGCNNLIVSNSVCSGNAIHGLTATNCNDLVIHDSYFGTNATGTASVQNANMGIVTSNCADLVCYDNVVSGNAVHGAMIQNSSNGTYYGNHFGVNAAGNAAVANQAFGILFLDACNNIRFGGSTSDSMNVVSGNNQTGIGFQGSAKTNVTVIGNHIGVNLAGTAGIGNQFGILDNPGGTNGFVIEDNVISGHQLQGINIDNATGLVIQGNRVGTNAAGTAVIANGLNGVDLNSCHGAIIGGPNPGDGNLLSGTAGMWQHGIILQGVARTNNAIVEGNYIGTNINGLAMPGPSNMGYGIVVKGSNNIVRNNIISGNAQWGLLFTDGSNNLAEGNLVGADIDTNALGNGTGGICVRWEDGSFPTVDNKIISNVVAYNGSNYPVNPVNSTWVAPNQGPGIGVGVLEVAAGNPFTDRIWISENEIFCNAGKGIDLNLGETGNEGNNAYASPTITSSGQIFAGTGSAGDTIEIYLNGSCNNCFVNPQGGTFVTKVVVNGAGNWTYDFGSSPSATPTAIARNSDGNTSQFSECVVTCSPPPSATITPSTTQQICSGDSVTLTAGPSGYHYTWFNGAAQVQSGLVDSLVVTAAGSYTVRVADISDPGNASCRLTSSAVSVIVNSPPVTSSITGDTLVCFGDTATYMVVNTGGTYVWTVPSGANIFSGQNSNSISVDWGTASSGTISVTETDGNLCTGSAVTLDVTVQSLPVTGAINGPLSLCEDSSSVSYSTSGLAGSTFQWTVDAPASITSGAGSDAIMVDFTGATGSVNISVAESTSDGCADPTPEQVSVTLNAPPGVISITGNQGVACNATGEVYTVSPTSATSSYQWVVPSGATIVSGQGDTTMTVDFGTSGGNISVIETNASGCAGAQSDLVISTSGCGLEANFSINRTNICVGDTVIYTDVSSSTSGTIDSWTWDFGTGANPPNATGVGPHTVVYSSVGSATTQLTVTEGPASDDTVATNLITINGLPSAPSLSGDTLVCEGDTGSYNVVGIAGSSYTWTSPSGSIFVFGETGPDNDSSAVFYQAGSATGNVTVFETSAAGCVGPATQLAVTVNTTPATPGSISIPAGTICDGVSGSLYNFSVSPVTGADMLIWSVPSGATITSGQGTENITVDFGSASGTNLFVSVAASNSCGISNSSSQNIDVEMTTTPQVFVTGGGSPVCPQDAITFTANINFPDSLATYQWLVDGSPVSGATSSTYQVTAPVNGMQIMVIATSAEACVVQSSDSASAPSIVVLPSPMAEAGPDHSFSNPETFIINSTDYQLNTTSSGVTYQWSSSVDDMELTNTNPSTLFDVIQASPTEPVTVYTLSVSNGQCTATDSFTVTILFDIYIPSGFTPNNDGNNDLFQIKNIDQYPGNKIWIYNRWGSLVYEGSDYGITEPLWNGTSSGKDLPMATYYYILDLNNGTEQIAGPVTIIK